MWTKNAPETRWKSIATYEELYVYRVEEKDGVWNTWLDTDARQGIQKDDANVLFQIGSDLSKYIGGKGDVEVERHDTLLFFDLYQTTVCAWKQDGGVFVSCRKPLHKHPFFMEAVRIQNYITVERVTTSMLESSL